MSLRAKMYCVGVVLWGILFLGTGPETVSAEVIDEIMVSENSDNFEDTKIPEDPVVYGILTLENDAQAGVAKIIDSENSYLVSVDYFEIEIPMNDTITIAVYPRTGYRVKEVLVDKGTLRGDDNCYRTIMDRDFKYINIVYEVNKNTGGSGGGNSNDSPGNENPSDEDFPEDTFPGEKIPVDDSVERRPRPSPGTGSVSAISYDVTVTYRDENGAEDSDYSGTDSGKSDYREEGTVPQEKSVDSLEHSDEDNDKSLTSEDEDIQKDVATKSDSFAVLKEWETPESRLVGEESGSEKANRAMGIVERPEIPMEYEKENGNYTQERKEKSVLILSNLPLYLLLVCCMIIKKQVNKTVKKVDAIDG